MKFLALLLCLLVLTGCSSEPAETVISTTFETTRETIAATEPAPTLPPDPIRDMLDVMSLEERVGQLFLARCDDSVALAHIDAYHLGGFVLFGRDFENQTPDSLREKIAAYQAADITSQYVSGTVTLMNAYHIGSCLKHFPGYGNNADTHTGIAVDGRSLGELEANDLLPFAAGIETGCGAIMVSHTIVQALDAELPASLSPAVHQYMRETMGFEGVIVTDDLVMQAITDLYGTGEAAVMAVLAGNDLLCSTDYVTQYEAVLAAVLDGRIHIDTLNSAVRNVLEWKMELGLLQTEK